MMGLFCSWLLSLPIEFDMMDNYPPETTPLWFSKKKISSWFSPFCSGCSCSIFFFTTSSSSIHQLNWISPGFVQGSLFFSIFLANLPHSHGINIMNTLILPNLIVVLTVPLAGYVYPHRCLIGFSNITSPNLNFSFFLFYPHSPKNQLIPCFWSQ